MNKEQLFPTIIILLDIAASLFYIPCHNWRMVAYWFSAAILTAVVTW